MTECGEANGILLYRFNRLTPEENTCVSPEGRHPRLDPKIQTQAFQSHTVTSDPPFPNKWGCPAAIPQRNQTPTHFFIPPISTLVDSSPSRPRIHLTMRCQARRGRRRGACCRRHKSPARCNGLPPDEGLDTKVTGSDAQELDTPIGRTCLRGTQTRRRCCREHPRQRGETNGGDEDQVENDRRPHPPGEGPGRIGAPSGGNLPGHRPG